jgi:hypothetical protein
MRLEVTLVEDVESKFIVDMDEFVKIWKNELADWDEDADVDHVGDMEDFLHEIVYKYGVDINGLPLRDKWRSEDGQNFQITDTKEVI